MGIDVFRFSNKESSQRQTDDGWCFSINFITFEALERLLKCTQESPPLLSRLQYFGATEYTGPELEDLKCEIANITANDRQLSELLSTISNQVDVCLSDNCSLSFLGEAGVGY